MIDKINLSDLVGQIQETVSDRFEGHYYWVSAQLCNVKKYESSRRCYLTLEEYRSGTKTAEIKAVFWSTYYSEIERFEKLTQQTFKDGIEIICKVRVKMHTVYGLQLEVLQIDLAHTLGSLELERQQTIDRLLKENPETIRFTDGIFRTYNNLLKLPLIIQRIALIAPPNSDGQRDFLQEITKNKHGYNFQIKEFPTTIQGDNAHKLILEQLMLIGKEQENFDVVAIVRGGGSQTDFKPFNDYDLARHVANFPIPIYTGIGHDRNQSLVDMMATEQKTPTKVASLFVEHNFEFENDLIALRSAFFDAVEDKIRRAKDDLANARRIVRLSSPEAILKRGFAIVTFNDQIITDPKNIHENAEIKTLLQDETIYSTVTKKMKNEKGNDL